MILMSPIQVHARWIPSGSFFIWAELQGSMLEAEHLKSLLFAWHEPSFYGTFIETMTMERIEGLALGAEEALEYFARPSWNEHASLQWDEQASALLDIAPHLLIARERDAIVPDFRKWKQGRVGWKLLRDDIRPDSDAGDGKGTDSDSQLEVEDDGLNDAGHSPIVEAWLDFLMAERLPHANSRMMLWGASVTEESAQLSTGEEVEAKEDKLSEIDSLAGHSVAEGWPVDLFENERDWLVAIGWLPDPSPFRVCLQIQEPDGSSAWTMTIVLQDREAPAQWIACTPSGEPIFEDAEASSMPEHWGDPSARIRQTMAKWFYVVPWLRSAGTDSIRTFIEYSEAWDFLMEKSLRLAELGLPVLLPAWWEQLRQMKPRMKARMKSSVGSARDSLFGLNQIMQFDWRLSLGGLELSESEFDLLMKQNQQLTQIRGQWVLLDPALLEQVQLLMKQVHKRKGLTFRDVLEMHLTGNVDGTLLDDSWPDEERDASERLQLELELNEHLHQFIAQLSQASAIPRIDTPPTFQGKLRNYQVEGASWLLFLREFGLGACLADDMGLGKTIQMITYLLHIQQHEKSDAPSLLICPTSVLGNWQKELERFAPTLRVKLHYGPNRSKGESFAQSVEDCDLMLTSYALAYLDEEELTAMQWNSVCLDEAQNIKNTYTKQATSIRKLQAEHRIAMTGTPIENRLTELWSIFDFINPGYLGPLREFNQRFVASVERDRDSDRLGQLQRLVKPFLLRRVKKDPSIELDLPDKLESKTYVSLTGEQAALYETYIHDLFDKLDRLSPMERRGLILASLTKLKQICNHPAAFLKEAEPQARLASRSNKLERLLEMVKELRQEGDSCLIFTQFVEMGKLLEAALLKEFQEPVLFLHGGTPKAQRDRMIERFQRGAAPSRIGDAEDADGDAGRLGSPSLPAAAAEADEEATGIFILSLKAGGIGLNLTAANHVFHFDRWWNPAVENQATDRAFRIGQTKHVQVHKFVTLGTLEERIDEMIERKQGLSQQIVGSGEQWITEMSTDELKDLFSLRRQWIEG